MFELQDVKPFPLVSLGINPHSEVFAAVQTFEQGKNYLVMAPSGKGKSTLLHCLYGLRKDFSGEIRYQEQSVAAWKPDQWADMRQKELSIVFQDLRLFPQLSARENVQLKAGLTGHKTETEIEGMAEKLGIQDLLDKEAATLSYGQQQRVAVLRSLCQPFHFLLLDEPFSHLDDSNTEAAFALIQAEAATQKAGVILVSLGEQYPWEATVLVL